MANSVTRFPAFFRARPLKSALKVTLFLVIVSLLLFNQPFRKSRAATHDNNIGLNGLFSDQTALYATPGEPNSTDVVTVKLRTFKSDLTAANLKYYDSATNSFTIVAMYWVNNDATGTFDFWQGSIPASGSTKWYRFQAIDGSATAWYNASGASSAEPTYGDFWIVPGWHTASNCSNQIGYQIFPDRFNNSNSANDVKNGEYIYQGYSVTAHSNWNDLPANPGHSSDFFGGDINGITQKIDPYLKQTLGVNLLYVNPVWQSPSNHKYDIQNFTNVDPHFGSNSDLQNMITTAHTTTNYSGDYRMGVFLDGVWNHTSDWHQWFDRNHLYTTNGAYESQSSQWYNYFTFQSWPNTYSTFYGFSGMPKLNYDTQAVRDSIYNNANSPTKLYLASPYNIDGWRLDSGNDVTNNLTENHQVWQQYRTAVHSVNASALIIGEYWAKPTDWLHGDQWDGAMNYNGFAQPVSEFINGTDYKNNPASITVSNFDSLLHQTRSDNPQQANLCAWNSLSTHDIARFLYRAGGDQWKMYEAIIFQMSYVGVPMIYYGDEIGLTGGNDPDNRRTFNWNTASWNMSIQNLYKKMISIRKQYSALRTGSMLSLYSNDSQNLYAFGRWDASHQIAIGMNNTPSTQSLTIPVNQLSVTNGSTMTDVLNGGTYTVVNGNVTVNVQGHYGVILVH